MTAARNISASIRQRLLNLARKDRRPFGELLQYYAMERFLYRLSRSEHADSFILKGALMLRVWSAPEHRPTMDIDMLGRTSNDEAGVIALIQDVLYLEVEADGLVFDPESVRAERITEDADYEGIRIRFSGVLGTARIHMQVDIRFGDVVHPEPRSWDFPTLLDSPTPRLLGYSRESAIAEKLEAMVKLGELNSRMKDFYYIWLLSRSFDFDGELLAEAVRLTFKQRNTELPQQIIAFTDRFMDAKQIQWSAFWGRLQQERVPDSFAEVVEAVQDFIAPVVSTLASGGQFSGKWPRAGPWS
jgi:hypothetical protein